MLVSTVELQVLLQANWQDILYYEALHPGITGRLIVWASADFFIGRGASPDKES